MSVYHLTGSTIRAYVLGEAAEVHGGAPTWTNPEPCTVLYRFPDGLRLAFQAEAVNVDMWRQLDPDDVDHGGQEYDPEPDALGVYHYAKRRAAAPDWLDTRAELLEQLPAGGSGQDVPASDCITPEPDGWIERRQEPPGSAALLHFQAIQNDPRGIWHCMECDHLPGVHRYGSRLKDYWCTEKGCDCEDYVRPSSHEREQLAARIKADADRGTKPEKPEPKPFNKSPIPPRHALQCEDCGGAGYSLSQAMPGEKEDCDTCDGVGWIEDSPPIIRICEVKGCEGTAQVLFNHLKGNPDHPCKVCRRHAKDPKIRKRRKPMELA